MEFIIASAIWMEGDKRSNTEVIKVAQQKHDKILCKCVSKCPSCKCI